jgi:uncharacterized oligopeptide transporter (OPT) family protein
LGQTATDAFSRVASFNTDMASELLGVGYIIGVRTASLMMAGAVLGGLVIVPTLAISSDLDADDLYRLYLRSIGAGCVAAAGIISMGRTLPMIFSSFAAGLKGMRGGAAGSVGHHRTEDDMPMTYVLGGCLLLLVLLAGFIVHELLLTYGIQRSVTYAILGAILVLLFGFLFVTVSSRLTGEIGSSSNPISGMTVATLLMTCLIFLGLGMVEPLHAVLALSIGGVVCIAASNGGTTSQDLKTGFLLGATPKWQQWAILIGALTSAVVIGGTLLLFNSVGTVYSQRNLPQVNAQSKLHDALESVTHDGQEFLIWRHNKEEELPTTADPKKMAAVVPGIYLLDQAGHIRYQVDPTITGKVDQRDEVKWTENIKVRLDKKDLDRIKNTFAVFKDMPKGKQAPGTLTYYRLWANDPDKAEEEEKKSAEDKKKSEPVRTDVPKGLYLVTEDGAIVAQIEGTKVSMKFPAPKTQVMGIIINGLLQGKLNWALVMIGACIALMLELCGVSALAFAVGLYIPMQYSTPIFLGGLVRWGVDGYVARQAKAKAAAAVSGDAAAQAAAEVKAIAESETSPGMLLASGLIAGGSLAGVIIAFTEFLPDAIKKALDLGETMEHLFAGLFGKEIGAIVQQCWALVLFLALAGVLLFAGSGKIFRPPPEESSPPGPPTQGPDTRIQSS